jgi:hypothetical protein
MGMKWLINYPDKAPHVHLQDLSLPWAYLQRVARKVITNWTNRKYEEYWQSIHG